ncbi:AfsR/SARP family transcriptional regulator [Microbacterium sp. A93]|uniref:AfsR/SARP family transcriptional regulator n=1 Tax=Microbacterium sp. A93 TaxID=3450716 RepID=UPI003F42E8F0
METRPAVWSSSSAAYPLAPAAPATVSPAPASPARAGLPLPAARPQDLLPDSARPPSERHLSVHLLGGPWVTVPDGTRDVPDGSKRLLAFLALDRRPLDRRYVSGSLWPDTDDERAAGCLRTSLWRLQRTGLELIAVNKASIRLAPSVQVDAEVMTEWADRVLTGPPTSADLSPPVPVYPALHLLPGWFDDWVLVHRDRLRQRVLHALDAVARSLCDRGDFAGAIDAGVLAVEAEPLRESAQRALIGAHLAEGNLVEARRVFTRFRSILWEELRAAPSADLHEAVDLPRPR